MKKYLTKIIKWFNELGAKKGDTPQYLSGKGKKSLDKT